MNTPLYCTTSDGDDISTDTPQSIDFCHSLDKVLYTAKDDGWLVDGITVYKVVPVAKVRTSGDGTYTLENIQS